MRLFGTMEVVKDNLSIGGVDTTTLVEKFGTPLYVIDEALVRDNCRRYFNSFKVKERDNRVAYAGKAFLTIAMCQIIKEEGLNLDVVSGGELYTAFKSGFPMERIYFHGNNKTFEEINMALGFGIGRVVVDNIQELEIINKISLSLGRAQDILLRVTPGIEAHTHEYIKTGQIDSKFGFSVLNGNLIEIMDIIKEMKGINFRGLHCHIGSQIFEPEAYEATIDVMTEMIRDLKKIKGISVKELNLGGGFGIYYKEGDEPKEIEEFSNIIINRMDERCRNLDIELPRLIIEPGRSIVGNAGTTLYTVGSIKDIPNVRKYVSVDGGMTDNIRPSLYNAEYECVLANKVTGSLDEQVTISGKCCESGDVLLSDVKIPIATQGDVLAVLSTGAYCYAMSSNYNKIPKAPVVLVKGGRSTLICKRETYEDIIKNELYINAV
ncbi:diaminopimelate decarboxylase [Clostridium amazonitimonense]|uniref:diaminopimelate decarboxylase n=1 Tax=Clostridium amazonitimonense TaxID=1499689 RepID=UPI000509C5D8|nr:diaminopimelate decarboxylase [Clostridium amazonitimonense]